MREEHTCAAKGCRKKYSGEPPEGWGSRFVDGSPDWDRATLYFCPDHLRQIEKANPVVIPDGRDGLTVALTRK